MVAIYARQSVDKKDSISIESQIEFCKKELDKSEEYKVYEDRGFSGKDTNRPAFESMMRDIKAGLISKVVVYKLDRISRSTLDFARIVDVFKKYNIDFISSTEKFDTSTPIGKAMLQIIMVFAELERETIQKRIKDNYYSRGKKGFFMGGTVPYGFRKVITIIDGHKTSTFEKDFEQLPHLLKMYELYANTDMSLGNISDYLNENNVPAPNGGRWDSAKISRILRNPAYVRADADVYSYYKNKGCIITNDISDFIGINGCYLYGKRESNERKYTNVKDHVLSIALHEGVVDSDVWLLCQYKLDNNKQIKNSGRGKHTWLSGFAKCGYCGYAVSVVTSNGGRYKYFNCRGKTNLKICNGHSRTISVEEVERIVEKYLLEKVAELKSTTLTIEERNSADVNRIKLQILEIDRQIENLLNQLAESNAVVTKYINNKITNLDRTKNDLVEEMKKIILENSKKQPVDEVLKQIDNWADMSIEDKKAICRCFIDKIYIKDDEIKIDWKI